MICPVGRTFQNGHPTCQSCQVPGCVSREVSRPEAVKPVKAKPFSLTAETIPEDTEQINLARWLDTRKLLWMHTPNGGARDMITGARLKSFGVKRGVPDVLIFSPPPATDHFGTAIELKRRDGGSVSKYQDQWLTDLTVIGWLTSVCFGWEEAVSFLKEAGY